MSGRTVARFIGSLVGAAGVAWCVTLLSLSMRSVQSIGGSCASGGPYQIAHQCPKGIAGLFPLSIFGGLIFLGLFAVCSGDQLRPLTLLAWPALFLSLGWNFLDYGLGLTTGNDTTAGFLVCGVVFILMGGIPLVLLLPSVGRAITGRKDESSDGGRPIPTMTGPTSVQFAAPTSLTTPSASSPTGVRFASPAASTPFAAPSTPVSGPSESESLATELERLASLHRRRELTDSEYEAAKRQALANPRSNP